MGELASRFASEDHITEESASAADAVSAGQLGGPQNTGDGDLDVRAGDYAGVHAALRLMAEYGGINSTDH